MAEYIEREQVKDELLSWAVCINHPEHLLKEDALCVIDAIPAADVVEVVRCGECEHFAETKGKDSGKPCGYGQCKRPTAIRGIVCADDFCSYGERRDSNGT